MIKNCHLLLLFVLIYGGYCMYTASSPVTQLTAK